MTRHYIYCHIISGMVHIILYNTQTAHTITSLLSQLFDFTSSSFLIQVYTFNISHIHILDVFGYSVNKEVRLIPNLNKPHYKKNY